MRTRPCSSAVRHAGIRLRRVAALCAALASSGCAGLVGSLVGAITGEEVTIPEDPSPDVPRSVYLRGPVPGWEYEALRSQAYRLPPSLFQVDLFAGACPGLRLAGGESADPFGTARVDAHLQLFEFTASHAADRNYYRFGTVTLAGVPDPVPPGAFARMLAQAGGACTSVGIPLLSLGWTAPYVVHR